MRNVFQILAIFSKKGNIVTKYSIFIAKISNKKNVPKCKYIASSINPYSCWNLNCSSWSIQTWWWLHQIKSKSRAKLMNFLRQSFMKIGSVPSIIPLCVNLGGATSISAWMLVPIHVFSKNLFFFRSK
jgi:hypothetical protein